jgi:hypothetical protein
MSTQDFFRSRLHTMIGLRHDAMHAALCAASYNLRWLLRHCSYGTEGRLPSRHFARRPAQTFMKRQSPGLANPSLCGSSAVDRLRFARHIIDPAIKY